MLKKLYPAKPILIVDDEKTALKSYELAFLMSGFNNIITCDDSRNVMDIIASSEVEMVLLDLIMPFISGDELLTRINSEHPGIPVIMVTGVNEIDTAVSCMKNGATDYILKPVTAERLMERVKKVFEFNELKRENILLQERLLDLTSPVPEAFSKIITLNKNMLSLFRYCEAIAKSRQPVLITGETGAGKELFAQALHKLSGCQGDFVPVNIAGFDDNLLSDTLFGHRKGAFTGAMENREGMIEKASSGTLFLDEIGDLNISSQVKLLRLLQEREYSPLGSDLPKHSDARVILATHQDLRALQKDSKFRKDLYYRISTHHIHIPPLRERKDDIKLLLDYFIMQAAHEMNKKPPVYHGELVNLLSTYHFPGNIRELQSMVFDAVSNHTSKMLSMSIFKARIEMHTGNITNIPQSTNPNPEERTVWTSSLDTLPTLKQACHSLVEEAFIRANGNQSIAARMLGISPQAFSARLKNHDCGE